MKEVEFFGQLIMKIVRDDNNSKHELIDWVIVDMGKTLDREREIEDGDFLQVFDGGGNPVLSKKIFRDYKALYNPTYRKQIYNGMNIAWAPRGIDTGYWANLFRNQQRARLLKYVEEE